MTNAPDFRAMRDAAKDQLWTDGPFSGAAKNLMAALDCIDELAAALRFYDEPGDVKPGAAWSEDYPGGITYHEGGKVILDMGEVARAVLTKWGLTE